MLCQINLKYRGGFILSKVYSLENAIKNFVNDGDYIAFGGFTTNRKPYAALYEIVRQNKGDFILDGGPAGGEADILIGEKRVKAYINAYTANSGYTNVARRFRSAIEKGELTYEDYSLDAVMMMMHAASLGIPFVPVRLMMGSDVANKWGISKEARKSIAKLPNEKFVEMENPYNPSEKILALPVPKFDTAIIHVQKASPDGTCYIAGDEFHDVDIAIAAKKCIVTCEELVSNEEIRKNPEMNSIPGFVVDAIVHTPHGAHPSQCYDYYDYDGEFLKYYDKVSRTEEEFKSFTEEWIYLVKNHNEYLDKLGYSRIKSLDVVPGLGYSRPKGGVK
jgi:glutaconate CoA-transferase subunit A